ncbi:hypothetical protein O6H91_14G070700 [Diphasiastrum complanatum]|nr:hypothetical protein O6H91_14G070700 [Diphasiastrum complanatum]
MDVLQLLQNKQEDSALIRVENVIREQNILDAFNVIETYCELVSAQMSIIDAQKVCPVDLQEAVSSLLYAGPRCAELPELLKVRKLFVRKYGQDFVTAAIELHSNCGVSKKIIEKLSGRSPSGETKENLLKKIALENGLQWSPPLKSHEDTPVSRSMGASKASSSRLPEEAAEFLAVKTPKTDYSQVTPKTKPAPPANVDDSSSGRHSVFNGSTYPEKPTKEASAEHDEAPYKRQFVPFVSTEIGKAPSTLSESGDVKRKQVVPPHEKATPSISRDSGQPTMLTTQQKTGNYTADRDSRIMRQDSANQNHVDQLCADDEEHQLSKSSYYKAVAAAAEAAAISAESAAAAARTAAKLAHSGLSRENSTVSDDEEEGNDFKHAKTIPIQEKTQKAGSKKDTDKIGKERNLDVRSTQPTKQRASGTLKNNEEKGKMTEISDEDGDDVDAPNYLEGRRHQPRAVLDQTSSDSEQELEHNEVYKINTRPTEKSSLKSNNPVFDEYNYQQTSSANKKVYTPSNKGSFQDEFSWSDDIDHGRANSKHSELKPEGFRSKPEELFRRNERNDIFSMSVSDEHEKIPFTGQQIQRLDSEISRPIFDEAFKYKSMQQLEEFYGTKNLEKHETTWEDDEDEAIWSKQKIQNFSNQKMTSVPRVLRPGAVESLEAETDSEIDEEPSSRKSATALPRSYKAGTAPQTRSFPGYASDEPGSPIFHENGSKIRFDKPLYNQNQMGESKVQEPPQKFYEENLTSYKKNVFNGRAAKQNLASEFERMEISSHTLGGQKKYGTSTWDSDDVEKDDYLSSYSSSTQYEKSFDFKPRAISPVYDENVADHFGIADVKKPSNLQSRPKIGESVRSRRTR